MNEQHTLSELIQILRGSNDLQEIIMLLEKFNEYNADTRNKINVPLDSLELRQGIVKVIDSGLIAPLKNIKERNKMTDQPDYR